jgi:putative endonuclease
MYILECADGSYYTGSTKDLERRLWEHKNGLGANHTAKRLPVKLVYCEECDRIDDAFYREKQVQGWSRKKKEALMASDYNQIHLLAVCRNETHCVNVGFDSAQPTGSDTAKTTENVTRSLSGVEGKTAETGDLACSLSGVETSTEGIVD